MQNLLESLHYLWAASSLATILAQLARVVVERPALGDFGSQQLDDDVHRLYTIEVVGPASADAERDLGLMTQSVLQFTSPVDVERIAEHHLLLADRNAEGSILRLHLLKLLIVVAAIYAQTSKATGKVFREVAVESLPLIRVVKVGSQTAAVGMSPGAHGYVVGHLWPIHSSYGRYILMRHGAYRRHVILHGQIDVAGTCASSGLARFLMLTSGIQHGLQGHILGMEAGTTARTEVGPQAAMLQHLLRFGVALVVVSLVVELAV